MSTIGISSISKDRTALQIIAIVPVYNEEKVLVNVMEQIFSRVNHLIIINDGSTDSSLTKIKKWMDSKENVYCLSLPKNVGASGALLRGYTFLLRLLKEGTVKKTDLVVELDADGQHDPEYIPVLYSLWKSSSVDVVQACRDFSNYPRYKVFGNKLLTLAASLLCRVWFKDVASKYTIRAAHIS